MKRPFACVGFTLLLSLTAAIFCIGEYSLWIAGGFLAAFVVSMFFPSLRLVKVVPLTLAVAALSFFWFSTFVPQFSKMDVYDGQDLLVTARITERPEDNGRNFIYIAEVMEAEDLDGEKVEIPGKVRVTAQNALAADAYDSFSGKIHLYLPEETIRPYYAAHGITVSAFLYEYEGVSIERCDEKPWQYAFLLARDRMEDVLFSLLPEREAGLVSGIVLGDRSRIPEDLETSFRMAGVSHLLAVSGLHLSVLIQAILWLLQAMRIPRRVCCALTIPVVLGFMALTGFSYSVLRSGLMFLLYLIAELIERKPDGLNSLGVAAFLICLGNPFAVGDIGFLLSFFSTLGIQLFYPGLSRWFRSRFPMRLTVTRSGKVLQYICDSVSLTMASSIFTVPICIFSFGTFSVLAVFSNLLLVFPGTALLISGAVTVLLGLVCLPAASPAGLVAGLLARYEDVVSSLLSNVPYAVVGASYSFVYLWIALLLFLVGICLMMKNRRKLLPKAVAISLAGLIVGLAAHCYFFGSSVSIESFYYDGKICVLASKGGRGAVLWGGPLDSYQLASHCVNHLDYEYGMSEESGEIWEDCLAVSGYSEDACFLTVYGVTILVCEENCDAAEIPEDWRSPDYLWLLGTLENPELLSPETAIILDEESQEFGFDKMMVTERYGYFVITCSPEGEARIGRGM